MDLFEHADAYPDHPGYKGTSTSREAAEAIAPKVSKLQDDIMALLRTRGNMTAHEVAAAMGMSKDVTSPRLSELRALKKIAPSGQRRPNAGGRSAVAWRAVG